MTGTEYVDRGAAIQLVCNASGRPDPPHNVDWYKVYKFGHFQRLSPPPIIMGAGK